MGRMRITLLASLGGAIWGTIAGIFGGALVGAALGAVWGDLSWGVNGAILGGVTVSLAGAVYGAVVGAIDKPPDRKSKSPRLTEKKPLPRRTAPPASDGRALTGSGGHRAAGR